MNLEVNHKMDGQSQHEWRWLIAAYLFLGGLGSGAYIVGAIAGMVGGVAALPIVRLGTTLSWPLVAIGSIFLILDLGQKGHMFKVIAHPQESWISRGAIVITLFMGWSFIHFLGSVFSTFAVASSGAAFVFGVVGGLLALGTMLYTGALLSASKAIALWRTGMLPVLFMISALMTGVFLVALGSIVTMGSAAAPFAKTLGLIGAFLLIADLAGVFFFLNTAFVSPDAKEGAVRMLKEPTFIWADLVGGLLVPLVLLVIVFFAKSPGLIVGVTALASILAIAGGLMLRYSVLSSGYMVSLNTAGFQFRRSPMTMAKVDKGLLPPT